MSDTKTPHRMRMEIQKILLVMQGGLEEIEMMLNKIGVLNYEKKSCMDCIEWDSAKSICYKFKVIPPIYVAVDPVKNCPDFDFIPF